jgi:nucleotide-binding universal stress UspA family protein
VTLVLLRVVEPVLPVAADGLYYARPFDETAALAAAQAELEQVAAGLRAQGWTVEVQTVLGYPASSIAAIAAEAAVDAIAMATHGREGVARLVLGSVATGVLQRSHVPLLLVRSRAVPRAATTPRTVPEPAAEARGVTVTLTPRELQLVQRGLEELLRGAERETGRRADDAQGAILAGALARRLAAEGERTRGSADRGLRHPPAEMMIV